jgi:hypothetical protein
MRPPAEFEDHPYRRLDQEPELVEANETGLDQTQCDSVALVGPRDHIAEQLAAWRAWPLDTLIVEAVNDEAATAIAELW